MRYASNYEFNGRLLPKYAVYGLGSRRGPELKSRIGDRDVLLLIRKAIFRARSVHFLDDKSRDLVAWRDLQQNPAHSIRQRHRHSP